jgi:hypothetical protein
MLIASRAVGVAAETGAPLPEVPVLKPLHDMGVVFREGKLVMIAGPSSGGKSMLAQYIVAMMNVPTLYLAADMDPDESISRLIATFSGIPTDEVREDMMSYVGFLEDCNIQFCFQENPSVDDIYLELDAYVEAWDHWPVLIVVDNLMDVDAGDESYQGQLFIMQELRNIAKRTGACVIVLAHTQSEAGSDYGKPQPRNKILNKVDQKPQLIFTLGRDEDLFRIAVVKDRNSRATDPTAKRFITIRWHGDTASYTNKDGYGQLRWRRKWAGE